jgi:hypothetical protein
MQQHTALTAIEARRVTEDRVMDVTACIVQVLATSHLAVLLLLQVLGSRRPRALLRQVHRDALAPAVPADLHGLGPALRWPAADA